VKSSDVLVLGAGVIGLSIAWRLQRAGLRVHILERTEPAREASHAAAGMLAVCDPHNDPALQPLAELSAAMYPEFVHELEDESQLKVDLRDDGVISFFDPSSYSTLHPKSQPLTSATVLQLEPGLVPRPNAHFLPERWLDPRLLCSALLQAFKDGGGDVSSGSPVIAVHDREVQTEHATYAAEFIINCTGAWAGQLTPGIPTRPVKGQMLSVVPVADPAPHATLLRHIIRATDVYLVPRTDGRIIIGSSLEEAGFDKNINSDVIHQLRTAAASMLPAIESMRIHEVWSGLRPGTPDGRPLIGRTSPAHLIAAGHYRDGILLAPATAAVILSLVQNSTPPVDLRPFAPNRFQR
jgi:glycine oxidase